MTDQISRQEHDARWGPWCELYVMDAMDESQCKSFEQHAVSCQTCAQLLQREAEFELSLIKLATHATRRVRPRISLRNRVPFAVAAGLAVCLALVFATFKLRHEPMIGVQLAVLPAESPAGLVIACPDETRLASCRTLARRHGLQVQYPVNAGEIPRYELIAASMSQ
jgi:hypothetical protein